MTWQTGTVTTDYLAMLDTLSDIASSNHVATAVISAAGTGYAVNDVLTAVGGTFTFAATFIVDAVTAGAIDTLHLFEGGAYTSNPTSPVATTVSPAGGTGATVTVTFAATGWTVERESTEALSAVVTAGGTGYSVGNDLTIVGGLGGAAAATFNVDTAPGGIVGTVSLITGGDYEETPTNPAATTVSPAGGIGCTLTVTYQRSTGTTERVLILSSAVAGAPVIGIKTFQATDVSTFKTVRNWGLVGMTSFNSGLLFHQQAGISPGFNFSTGAVETTFGGAFMILKENTAFDIDFWASIDDRRVILVCKVGNAGVTHYSSMHMGFFDSFGTATEFPFPIFICGSSGRHNSHFEDTVIGRITGIAEMIGVTTREGPAFYRKADSTWQQVRSGIAVDSGSPSRTSSFTYPPYPTGRPQTTGVPIDDLVVADGPFTWPNIIPTSGDPGIQTLKLERTPDTGGDLTLLIPITVMASENETNREILGELNGVFWFSAEDGQVSEDTITFSTTEVYRVFKGGNRAETFSHFAIREQ